MRAGIGPFNPTLSNMYLQTIVCPK